MNCTNSYSQPLSPSNEVKSIKELKQSNTSTSMETRGFSVVKDIDSSNTLKKEGLMSSLFAGLMAYGIFNSTELALFSSLICLLIYIGSKKLSG